MDLLAERLGFQAHDIIVAINGITSTSTEQMEEIAESESRVSGGWKSIAMVNASGRFFDE